MLRITDKSSQIGNTVLLLEGQLIGPWVAELNQICTQIGSANPLNIDLGEVLFADRKGIALLRDLRNRGAVLINASSLLREQLNGG